MHALDGDRLEVGAFEGFEHLQQAQPGVELVDLFVAGLTGHYFKASSISW